VDRHHTQKKDAPSGTAKALMDALKQAGFRQDAQVASFREGALCGHHTLHLTHAHERLSLSHDNFDRQSLALGALKAAQWLVDQPAGLYTMEDMLNLPVLQCSPSEDKPNT
jgi:4-hydroxy-tetrahydrodipicolinate reductase